MKYNLFLDDERTPSMAGKYMEMNIYYDLDWVTVRNYNQFVECVEKNGLPEVVSFDHDLADIHYNPKTWVQGFKYQEKTGKDCAIWMVNYCMDTRKEFPKWFVHSMNPVGSKSIRSYITSYLKSLTAENSCGCGGDCQCNSIK